MAIVSVIIPCYNYGHLIAETIESIIAQTYTDWELVIVDDGSTDHTKDVVETFVKMDNRIQLHSFENGGLGEARNRGLRASNGKYIQFLDADDLIEKRKFELQLKMFAENSAADIIYGSVRYFTTKPFDPADRKYTFWGKEKEWMPKFSGKGHDFLSEAVKVNFSHLSSPLFTRKIVEKVGFFDGEISAVADHHFLQRCVIANANFIYYDQPETLSLVRWHSSNMSKNVLFMKQECIKAHERLIPLLSPFPVAYQNNLKTIKSFKLETSNSWKKVFLSGGMFDFVKPVLRAIKVDRLARHIFYKRVK